MKIAVCVKRELDARGPFQLASETKTLDVSGLVEVMDPASAAALSLAVQLAGSDDEILICSVGGREADRVLRMGLSYGATRAMRIWDSSFDRQLPSTKTISLLLSKVVEGFDIVLCGSKSLCGGSAFTGPAIAQMLGLPQIDGASWWNVEPDGKAVEAHRRKEHGDKEVVRCLLPVLMTVDADEVEAPYPSLPALLAAAEADIKVVDANALELTSRDMKDSESSTFEKHVPPRPRVRKSADSTEGMSSADMMAMLSGGGSAGKSKGGPLEGDADAVAEGLFKFLKDKGFIGAA